MGGEGARDSEPLALPARDVGPSLRDGRVGTVGHLRDELLGLRDAQRPLDVLVRDVHVGEGDVRGHGAREESPQLGHVSHPRAQVGERHATDVDAVERDGALGDVVEARDELHERRLARARGADDAEDRARADLERDVRHHARRRVGIGEAHVVEDELASRGVRVVRDGVGRVDDRERAAEHLPDAVRGDGRPREQNRDHGKDEEAHDDLHGVRDERHDVADLHQPRRDGVGAEPDDDDRDGVHEEHHERHHERHGVVGEELRGHEVGRGLVKAPELMVFSTEGPDGEKSVEHLARHEVDAVHESLHLAELRHGEEEEHGHHADEREDGGHDRPLEARVDGRDLHDGHHAHDGREHDHAHEHDEGHLDLLHVVGAPRDETRLREAIDLGGREVHHVLEEVMAGVPRDGGARARGDEAAADGGEQADEAEREHRARRSHQVVRLDGPEVHAEAVVGLADVLNGARLDDGGRRLAEVPLERRGVRRELVARDDAGLECRANRVEVDRRTEAPGQPRDG